MYRNFNLLSFVNHQNKTKCFIGDFIVSHRSFKFSVQIPGLPKNCEKMLNFRFNESTDNSIVEPHARVICYELCLGDSWKPIEII